MGDFYCPDCDTSDPNSCEHLTQLVVESSEDAWDTEWKGVPGIDPGLDSEENE